MEKGLHAQVLMLLQNVLIFTDANKNKNEAKFKFQGQYARSQHCFLLEFYWIEVHFSTLEPYVYKKLFQIHENTQNINTFKLFQSPIGD